MTHDCLRIVSFVLFLLLFGGDCLYVAACGSNVSSMSQVLSRDEKIRSDEDAE